MYSLRMSGVSKYFPEIKANENIDFSLKYGEIHALLGENGAGKSTLMNILIGLYRPDRGQIYIDDKEVKIHSPKDALSFGIGMVHQHFHLSERHTVFDNIIIGLNNIEFIPDRKSLTSQIEKISSIYGFNINLNEKIWQLTIGDQQKVEILKVLVNNPKILIFDEPTAVLTNKETEKLFIVLKELKKKGYSIIFISHKLDEVLNISDRITILSKGTLIDTIETEKTTKHELAEKMIGRKIVFDQLKIPRLYNENILSLKNAKCHNDKGINIINGLDIEIRKGEIFGIAGVSGNGQLELSEILFGLRKMEYDNFTFNNKSLIKVKPKTMMKLGMSLIPADRKLTGSAIGMNIPENLILNKTKDNFFSRTFFLNSKNIINKANESTAKYNIKHQNLKHPVKDLSGGNLQKVIVAREVEKAKEFLIAVYPTRGLDIGAIEFLHKILIEEQKKGATILLVSEELEEIFNLSDRIGVMFKGKIIKIFDREKATPAEISLAMGGVI